LTSKLKQLAHHLCIAALPEGHASTFKKKYLASLSVCDSQFSSKIQKLNFGFRRAKSPNDFSHVFVYNNKLLIPGDSPKKMERLWSPLIAHKKIKWLSLSHHGSKTSTSEAFLKNAPFLTQAIASARHKVYGHPHKIILNRLKQHGIATLRTEDWGNIHFLMNSID
jgi:beta-lactamase superfamily II metal-dependent hydrolase